jgi:DNA-binding response OmpR family regulator
VLVDLMLPGMDGFDCIRSLRRTGDVPIVVVSARDDTHDVVAALEAGPTTTSSSPWPSRSCRPGCARCAGGPAARADAPEGAAVRRDRAAPEAGEVLLGDEQVHLTRTEFRPAVRAGRPGRPGAVRAAAARPVWGYEVFGDDRLVDVHVGRLRRKIERDAASPKHLLTVRGLGYKLQA